MRKRILMDTAPECDKEIILFAMVVHHIGKMTNILSMLSPTTHSTL